MCSEPAKDARTWHSEAGEGSVVSGKFRMSSELGLEPWSGSPGPRGVGEACGGGLGQRGRQGGPGEVEAVGTMGKGKASDGAKAS